MYRKLATMMQIRQSPIDLRTEHSLVDNAVCQPSSLDLKYYAGDCCRLTISEGGFQVNVKEDCRTTLKACHLPAEYRLAQFHAHWGADSSRGSEHTVNGKQYAAEFHFVFWNPAYGSVDNALNYGDGLAVLGVFVEEGNHNDGYDPLMTAIREAKKIGPTVDIPNEFDMTRLLPEGDHHYFTYLGSLTTPPYSEAVIWTVLMNTVQLSATQMDSMRLLIKDNYRECQQLYGRKVFGSKNL